MKRDHDPKSDQTPAKTGANDDNSIQGSRRQNMRMLVWGVAGAYLLYLTVNLLKGLVRGEVPNTATKVMIIVASVVFTGAAIFLLIECARYALRAFKQSVNAMVEADEDTDDDAPEDDAETK